MQWRSLYSSSAKIDKIYTNWKRLWVTEEDWVLCAMLYVQKNASNFHSLSLKKNLKLVKIQQQFKKTLLRFTMRVTANQQKSKITDLMWHHCTIEYSKWNQTYAVSQAREKNSSSSYLARFHLLTNRALTILPIVVPWNKTGIECSFVAQAEKGSWNFY